MLFNFVDIKSIIGKYLLSDNTITKINMANFKIHLYNSYNKY